MAKLSYESLTLEIKYVSIDKQFIQHEIGFLWKGESVINDSILKRNSAYWKRRSNGTFLANEYEEDTLIETIEKILATNEPDYWEPHEPNITLAIYPEMFFPFLESHYQLIYVRENFRRKLEKRRQEKLKKGKLPDDPFTIVALIDVYNFENANSYSGNGISLIMKVRRKDVEIFCQRLKSEYAELKEKFKADKKQEESAILDFDH